MRTESEVERPSQDLRPVKPRSAVREAFLLFVLGIIEVVTFVGMGFMRPDMPNAMEASSFWWKLTSMGTLAVLGGRRRTPVGGSGSVAGSRVALDFRLCRRNLCKWLAHRRRAGWSCKPCDAPGLDPRAAMRPEDGSAFDSASHRFWHTDAPRGTDRPAWYRTCRGPVCRWLGCLRLRRSVRRPSLYCGLVHPRVHDCDDVGTGCVAEVVAMVRPSDYDQFWDTGHTFRIAVSRARAARVSLGQ